MAAIMDRFSQHGKPFFSTFEPIAHNSVSYAHFSLGLSPFNGGQISVSVTSILPRVALEYGQTICAF